MGKYTWNGVECFTPDNDNNTLYLSNVGYTLADLRQKIAEHFSVSAEEADTGFEVTTEYIHTDCLGLDYHDASDWTNFIVITRKG